MEGREGEMKEEGSKECKGFTVITQVVLCLCKSYRIHIHPGKNVLVYLSILNEIYLALNQ